MSQCNKLFNSPLNSQQPLFPTISYKTSESPSKVANPLNNYLLFEQKQDQIHVNKIKSVKQIKYEGAEAIYQYLHLQVFKKKDCNQEKPKIQATTLITDNQDKTKKSKEYPFNLQQLKQIQEKRSKQKLQGISKSYIDLPSLNLFNQIQDQCIVELDQEQDDYEQNLCNINQNQLNKSPNLYNNLKGNKNCKLLNQSKVVLDFNQQNKEYQDKSFQLIHLIRKVQKSLLKKGDNDRQQLEKDYKLKKSIRQKERQEGLQNAQQGLKNRQLKSLLNALKGSNDKQIQDNIVQNIARKHNIQRSQSTIISRKSSFQLSKNNYLPDEQFDEKLIRKFSQVSDVCSSENSLDQIQFPIKLQKLTDN